MMDVDSCHKVLLKNANKNNVTVTESLVIINFVNHHIKRNIMEKAKKIKKLSAVHFGFNNDNKVFVNECLSKERRHLYMHAKKAKLVKNYNYLWIKGGRILMRKLAGEQVIVINSEIDLEKL